MVDAKSMIDRKTDVRLVQIIYNGAKIDLVVFKNGRRIGVECKRADAPTITPSMRIALDNLKLDELQVVYPGEKRYRLSKRVEVVPLVEMVSAE
jgi:predicted AAA+ superfamily ATPase